MPLEALFDGRMLWDEAVLLMQELLLDPTSHTAAAVAKWKHPWTREARILADLFDLTVYAHTPKEKRHRLQSYPRPFETKKGTVSRKPTVPQAVILAALIARSPKEEE